MGRSCTVCRHAEREAMDRALVTRSATYRDLVARYGVTLGALARHADEHVPLRLVAAQDAATVAAGDTLLSDLVGLGKSSADLLRIARTILAKAQHAGDLRTAVAAVNAAAGVLRGQREQLELRQAMRETDEVLRHLDELDAHTGLAVTKGPERWRA